MNQNKTTKYFKYAIGEIILVVIGILIALQINNWNENRKNRVIETEYLKRLEEETKWNIEQLKYNASQYLLSSSELNKAIAYIEFGKQDSTILDLSRPNYIHPWIVKSSTYNELISTGDLKIIQDVHLRNLLDEANSFAYFAEQQLENWREMAIAHEAYFVPYKRNVLHKDSENKDYYVSAMDLESMKNDATIIELLKYWSGGNLVFHKGTNGLIKHYEKILSRIECIKQKKECISISKSIIKN